jgi:membrane associated rhomboid family serine protease
VIPLRDAQPPRRRPALTFAAVVACAAVYGLELVVMALGGDSAIEDLFARFGVIPSATSDALAAGAVDPTVVLSFVTYAFLHAGWLHLAGNLLYLWIFGNNVEDRLGRVGFAAFWIAGGAVAALAHVAVDPRSDLPLVGASGAVSAILGAYLVLYPGARVVSLVFLGFFYQLAQVPAIVLLVFWFALQLLDGVLSLGADSAAGGVAFFAHIGGFAFGLAVGGGLRLVDRLRRAPADGG